MEEKQIERFKELIREGDQILSGRQKGGGERKRSQGWMNTGNTYLNLRFDKVDASSAVAWAMKCLTLIEDSFGRESAYYSQIDQLLKGFGSSNNFNRVQTAVKIMNAAMEDFAKGFLPKSVPETIQYDFEGSIEHEAKFVTRIYLLLCALVFAQIALTSWFFFGIAVVSIISLSIIILGYVVSIFSLKEYTPSKLHERFIEVQRIRLRSLFKIDV